jgi:hypothetical protein
MRRKKRDILFDLEGLPPTQQSFSDLDPDPAHATPEKKWQISSNNRKGKLKKQP